MLLQSLMLASAPKSLHPRPVPAAIPGFAVPEAPGEPSPGEDTAVLRTPRAETASPPHLQGDASNSAELSPGLPAQPLANGGVTSSVQGAGQPPDRPGDTRSPKLQPSTIDRAVSAAKLAGPPGQDKAADGGLVPSPARSMAGQIAKAFRQPGHPSIHKSVVLPLPTVPAAAAGAGLFEAGRPAAATARPLLPANAPVPVGTGEESPAVRSEPAETSSGAEPADAQLPMDEAALDPADIEVVLHTSDSATIRLAHGDIAMLDVSLSVADGAVLAQVITADDAIRASVERAVAEPPSGTSFFDTSSHRRPPPPTQDYPSGTAQSVTPRSPDSLIPRSRHIARPGSVHVYA